MNQYTFDTQSEDCITDVVTYPYNIHSSIADKGLYLIIFERSIHNKEVVVANATPPHPRSKDQAVENSLADRRGRAGAWSPTTPSPVWSP